MPTASLDPLPWNYHLPIDPLPSPSCLSCRHRDFGFISPTPHAAGSMDGDLLNYDAFAVTRDGDNGDGSTTERDRPVCTASLHTRAACDGCLYVHS